MVSDFHVDKLYELLMTVMIFFPPKGLQASEINGPKMGYLVEWKPASSPESEKPTEVSLVNFVLRFDVLILHKLKFVK